MHITSFFKNKLVMCWVVLLVFVFGFLLIPRLFNKESEADISDKNAAQYGLQAKVQDGVILDCWGWSYETIRNNLVDIAAAGYSAVQTSPVQKPTDYDAGETGMGDQWWKLYQPVSLSIADTSWLGTKTTLKELCSVADNYGIKVIVTIEANNMGSGDDSTSLNEDVENYESQIYNDYGQYFHTYISYDNTSVQGIVQGNTGSPDLNTANSYVQNRVGKLLCDCIDLGVDGFRFEDAKCIETSGDSYYSSSFFETVIGRARNYAKSKGKRVYFYGVILGDPGPERSYSNYVANMHVTDTRTGQAIMSAITDKKASDAASTHIYSDLDTDEIVLWAESYESYMGLNNTDGIKSTKSISEADVNKAWALVGNVKGATAIYYARPSDTIGSTGSSAWMSDEVIAINKFHNAFINAEEHTSSDGDIVIKEKKISSGDDNDGIILVNVNGMEADVEVKADNVEKGDYVDEITGNLFKLEQGKLTGTIGDTGIAVLYCKSEKEMTTYDGSKADSDNGDSTKESKSGQDVYETKESSVKEIEVAAGEQIIYFNTEKCDWFKEKNTIPVLKAEDGEYIEMVQIDDYLYYVSIKDTVKSVVIARLSAEGNIEKPYSTSIPSGKNIYSAVKDWSGGGTWSSTNN